MSRFGLAIAVALFAAVGCEAGPSAFDAPGGGGPQAADSSADGATVSPETPTVAGVVTESPGVSDDSSRVLASSGAGPGGALPADQSEDGGAGSPGAADDGRGTVTEERRPSDSAAVHPRFPRPDAVRGIYLNAWASGSRNRVGALLELARKTEINSFVIDIKDATGFLSHATEVPMAHEIGATEEIRIRDLPALLDTLEAEGIYPIARIVIVKDPLVAAARPEMAVQDTASGVWVDSKGIIWLNPYDRRVWQYHVDIAREVAEMGFPEIQWDYVRFPDAPAGDMARAVFTGAGDIPRTEAIRGFFEYSRRELRPLGVQVTADVFGVTTSYSRDIGLGQLWEEFIDVVDVALPMVYPSHYWEGSFGIDSPNAYPYEVVRAALVDAVRRSKRVEGAGSTRPWLQDFSLGQPAYDAPEVRAQIQGTYDAGIDEWILWNPGSRYTEAALEPVGGFASEPMMRVGARILPVSRRWEVVDSVRVRPQESVPPPSAVDTVGAVARDTVASPAAGADTTLVFSVSGTKR